MAKRSTKAYAKVRLTRPIRRIARRRTNTPYTAQKAMDWDFEMSSVEASRGFDANADSEDMATTSVVLGPVWVRSFGL
jgi:hypothetical protein